ncbi:PstS family phosphate ABC transporter substrate-binding protein [Scytonema sp. NUACC21]
MSQKNETTILLLAVVITAGLAGCVIWWFTQNFGVTSILNSNNDDSSSNPVDSQNHTTQLQTFDQVKNVPSGLISYGGSTSWAPIRRDLDPEIQRVWSQFQLRYTDPEKEAPSSTTGIAMLLKSQLEFAQASRPVSNKEYEEAGKKGIQLKEIPVAIDGLAVVVNPNLNISGITINQFDDIFAGKITNWQQVGGQDLKIQPYGKKGRDTGKHFKLVETTTEAVRKVAGDPGGVYWAAAPLLVPQCTVKPIPIGRDSQKFIPPYQPPLSSTSQCSQYGRKVNIDAIRTGEYPLSRRLVVVIKQNGRFEQQTGEAYANLLLTVQGQRMIAKAGFVNIR